MSYHRHQDWFTVEDDCAKLLVTNSNVIKRDNRDQSMECLREMLATWLRGTDASPAALVQALISYGMALLARKVAVKYG